MSGSGKDLFPSPRDKCIDPNVVDYVIELLKHKFNKIMEIIDADWIDGVSFNVRVCGQIPDSYWVIRIDLDRMKEV